MKKCNAETLLVANRVRATKRRTAVLRTIIESDRPLNAADIHDRLARSMKIDLVTVYRTLSVLSGHGIVREIHDSRSVIFYEIACEHNPVHAHFRCRKCNSLTCLDSFDSRERAVLSAIAGDGEIDDITIIVTGTCRSCRKEINAS